MSTYAMPPATPAASSTARSRVRRRRAAVVGVTGLAVLAYTLIRPGSAQAAEDDLQYARSSDSSVITIYDKADNFQFQLDLDALKGSPGATATNAQVNAAFAEAREATVDITGWDLDKDIARIKPEAEKWRAEVAGAQFNAADHKRLQDTTAALFKTDAETAADCRGRCLALGTTVTRSLVLANIAGIAGLSLAAAGVVGLPSAGVMLGITVGINLLVLATQVYDQMRAGHDAGQNAALRQQANNALIRVMPLGETALQRAFEQAGNHEALNVAAQKPRRPRTRARTATTRIQTPASRSSTGWTSFSTRSDRARPAPNQVPGRAID